MIGLFFSQVLAFIMAALIGFAIGWRAYQLAGAARRAEQAREDARLRAALSEAQVRRARLS